MVYLGDCKYVCINDDLIELIEKNKKLVKKIRWYLVIISVSIAIYLYKIKVFENIDFAKDTFEVGKFNLYLCTFLSASIWVWITSFDFLLNDHISKNQKFIFGFDDKYYLLPNKLYSDEKRPENLSKIYHYLYLFGEFIFLRISQYLILYFSFTIIFHILHYNVLDLNINKRDDFLFNTSLNSDIIISFLACGVIIEFLYLLKRNRYVNYLNEIKEIDKLNFEARRRENEENLLK